MRKTFETFDELAASGYIDSIVDDGVSADRITVVFADGDMLGMDETGVGFSQMVGKVDEAWLEETIDDGSQVHLGINDLKPETKAHILGRVNAFFEDALEDLAAGRGHQGRRDVERRGDLWVEGDDSAGKGIYWDGENFHVACAEGDDLGPFADPKDAMIATLPRAMLGEVVVFLDRDMGRSPKLEME